MNCQSQFFWYLPAQALSVTASIKDAKSKIGFLFGQISLARIVFQMDMLNLPRGRGR
jgi:hypothetical protein